MARKSLHLAAPLQTRMLAVIRGLQQQFSACVATLPFLLASLSESGPWRSWLLFSTDSPPDLAPALATCRSAEAAFRSTSSVLCSPASPLAGSSSPLLKVQRMLLAADVPAAPPFYYCGSHRSHQCRCFSVMLLESCDCAGILALI